MPKHIIALIVTALLSAIAVVYGVIADADGFLAVGLTVAFLSLLFIPVLHQRANKRRRLFSRQDALLYWHYAEHETVGIAVLEAKKTLKLSMRLSILASVCLAIVFAPFVVIAGSPETRLLLLGIGVITVLLPFLSVVIVPVYTAALIRKAPSTTIIGRDYILINNRYIGINDRAALTLKNAAVKTGNDGTGSLILTYTFRMKYGQNGIPYTVEVPVPTSRTDEAVQFAENINAAASL